MIHVEQRQLFLHELHELDRVELLLAAVLAHGVQRRLQEVAVRDAGDLDRVLEREEEALARPLLGIELEQVLAVEDHLAARDLVVALAGEHLGERALAGSVGAHDGVHLARRDGERDAFEDRLVFDACVEVFDLKHGYWLRTTGCGLRLRSAATVTGGDRCSFPKPEARRPKPIGRR